MSKKIPHVRMEKSLVTLENIGRRIQREKGEYSWNKRKYKLDEQNTIAAQRAIKRARDYTNKYIAEITKLHKKNKEMIR